MCFLQVAKVQLNKAKFTSRHAIRATSPVTSVWSHTIVSVGGCSNYVSRKLSGILTQHVLCTLGAHTDKGAVSLQFRSSFSSTKYTSLGDILSPKRCSEMHQDSVWCVGLLLRGTYDMLLNLRLVEISELKRSFRFHYLHEVLG